LLDWERALLPATWATGVLWLLYGVVAIAAADGGGDLEPATSLNWAAAEVEMVERGARKPCPRAAGSSVARCSDAHWNWVGPYAARFAGEPQRCIWVHPPKRGAHLAITWQAVELGDEVSATLALLPRAGPGKPVEMRLYADGAFVARTTVDDVREAGRLEVRLPPGPAKGDVKVEIDTTDPTWRLACMRLHLRGRRRPGPATRTRRGAPSRPLIHQRGEAHRGR